MEFLDTTWLIVPIGLPFVRCLASTILDLDIYKSRGKMLILLGVVIELKGSPVWPVLYAWVGQAIDCKKGLQ